MIFASLFATLAVHWYLFRHRRLSDPSSALLLIYLYYSYFVPGAMVMSGDYQIIINDIVVWVNDADIALTSIVAFLGYVGFAVCYRLVSQDFSAVQVASERKSVFQLLHERTTLRVFFAVILIYIALIFTAFSAQFFSVLQGYSDKILINYENSSFSFVITAFLVIASIFFNSLILEGREYRAVTAIAVAFFVAVSLLTFSKGPFIFVAAAVLCAGSRLRLLPQFLALLGMVFLAAIVLIFLVPIFSWYRYDGTITWDAGLQSSMTTTFSDAAGPFAITIYAYRGYVPIEAHPLWESFVLWIPRFIWTDRPLDLPEDFARWVMVGWQPGYGMGFSPLAEAFARYGQYGVSILLAMFGLVIAGFQRLCMRFMPRDMAVAVSMTVGSYLLLASMRGSLSVAMTQGLQTSVPVILVGLIARQIAKGSATLPERSPA